MSAFADNPNRPPRGLKPRRLVAEERFSEIMDALARYRGARKTPPPEWFEEAAELVRWFKANPKI